MIYDVAVIGGGIHGAGAAQAAAAAGYDTIVLEAGSWAGATSSRSSKLIHGGLRYLESGEFDLVYQSLSERRLLQRLAPTLVRPQRFYIPLYPDSQRRPWQLQLGLSAYALLAGLGRHARFHRLSASTARQWPALQQQGLQAVFQYWDAQTDDQALTLAVLASARRLGARLHADTPVEAITRGEDAWQLHSPIGTVRARAVVNAAGPWVHHVATLAGKSIPQRPSSFVQGSHLVLDEALPLPGVWYLEAMDGRAIFALPWQGGTLLGTTEVEVPEPAPGANPQPSQEEETYLLTTLRRYLPTFRPTVIDRFAGLRVLPASKATAFRRSRDSTLLTDRSNRPSWVSLYGGKLTTYRHTSAQVLDTLRPYLGARLQRADTRQLMLPASSAADLSDFP